MQESRTSGSVRGYLDWYMDPYNKKDMSVIGEPLKELLQTIDITEKDTGVVEEVIYLLEAYTERPYVLLEKNIDKMTEEVKAEALFC